MSTPPIDFNGLDTVVHGPMRLGVLTALRIDGPLDFTTLKKRLGSSDGTLGQNLLKLEEIGYIDADKAIVGRRPKTTYRLTPSGTLALTNYLNAMRTLLDAIEAKRRADRDVENASGPTG
jgi:DNA-binding HxlR family transcriptional regulator